MKHYNITNPAKASSTHIAQTFHATTGCLCCAAFLTHLCGSQQIKCKKCQVDFWKLKAMKENNLVKKFSCKQVHSCQFILLLNISRTDKMILLQFTKRHKNLWHSKVTQVLDRLVCKIMHLFTTYIVHLEWPFVDLNCVIIIIQFTNILKWLARPWTHRLFFPTTKIYHISLCHQSTAKICVVSVDFLYKNIHSFNLAIILVTYGTTYCLSHQRTVKESCPPYNWNSLALAFNKHTGCNLLPHKFETDFIGPEIRLVANMLVWFTSCFYPLHYKICAFRRTETSEGSSLWNSHVNSIANLHSCQISKTQKVNKLNNAWTVSSVCRICHQL